MNFASKPIPEYYTEEEKKCRKKDEKKSRDFFSFALIFFSSLAFGICTIARRRYRWRKSIFPLPLLSCTALLLPRCLFFLEQNQKNSIDGQAMKSASANFLQDFSIFIENFACKSWKISKNELKSSSKPRKLHQSSNTKLRSFR